MYIQGTTFTLYPKPSVFLCSSFKDVFVTFVGEYSVDCNMCVCLCEISTVVCPTTSLLSHPLTPLWNDGINQMIPRFFLSLNVPSAVWGRQVKNTHTGSETLLQLWEVSYRTVISDRSLRSDCWVKPSLITGSPHGSWKTQCPACCSVFPLYFIKSAN